ncbi:hypothetical protein WS62_11395 [Burkholderia sp. ABCPW 14]|uniref:Uncharacterized protein n=1 Tax=Burkholderia mayonis TaxID=1385591 RepID=A0A1B4G315_9BURK|nr:MULTISPECIES: hypothetical protein [Burkholderia]AOJ10327.1 hypothetical protein WS71_24260 [Burkholderia mayonis]KVD70755.1 hypothetical protein WS62_11395 [Burkholderia sp. ABCPW 14]KVE53691.1 hypothetical protein WS71_06510 [Burkholderia mayonis]
MIDAHHAKRIGSAADHDRACEGYPRNQSNPLSLGNLMDSTAGRHDRLHARGNCRSNIKRYIRPLKFDR